MILFKKTKKYPKVVEEIHNEFFQASENLLKEAENILKESKTKVISKGLRLLNLGFKKTSQSTEAEKVEVSLTLSKQDKENVFYYQKRYPFNKFIAKAQVKKICHKYNLVCGNVDLFKGFVPEKNLIEIENFKGVKDKDTDSIISISTWGSRMGKIYYDNGRQADDFPSIFKKEGHGDILQICAPIKDMDTKGMEISEDYRLIKKSPPDPIVLQPVKGGYLIITAWGDEASDPDVINPINN